MTYLIAIALLAYLIGSIPFGLILTRMAGLGDIRSIGSGNIGATNVLRTGNKKIALATLLLDFGKGFAPITYLLTLESEYQMAIDCAGYCPGPYILAIPYAATCIVLGHMFPIWLKFKGGKGVACIFGIGFALSPIIGAWMAVCWLTVFALYRYSSLGALIGVPAGIIIASQNDSIGQAPLALVLPVILMALKHHPNIRRLIKGEEQRFSFSKKDKAP